MLTHTRTHGRTHVPCINIIPIFLKVDLKPHFTSSHSARLTKVEALEWLRDMYRLNSAVFSCRWRYLRGCDSAKWIFILCGNIPNGRFLRNSRSNAAETQTHTSCRKRQCLGEEVSTLSRFNWARIYRERNDLRWATRWIPLTIHRR